jgi:aminoglycoside phosphotransferase (APT) family kinase protein
VDLPELDPAAAKALVAEVLGETPSELELVPAGYAGQNWRAETRSGAYVVKVGPRASAAKWSAARQAHALAQSVGVPVPRLVHFAVHGDVVVRALEWVAGVTPAALADRPDAARRFGTELGTAVAALHEVAVDRFTSRLDGSGPAFDRWDGYVTYRLDQICARARANGTVDRATLERAVAAVTALARDVAEVARPTLCHRDLYADNLLVDDEGRLLAILDWDLAEAWDAAGEWFKLDWLLFPALPASEPAFDRAYRAVHRGCPRWEERKRLTDLMESLNTVANAIGAREGNDFDRRARARLAASLPD